MRILQLAALASVLAFAPVGAAVASVEQSAEAPAKEQGPLQDYFKELNAGNYQHALKLVSKLDLRDTKEAQGFKAALRAAALMGLKRNDDAQKEFAEADRLSPSEPAIVWLKLETGLSLNQLEVATTAVDTMISRFPDQAREIDKRTMWYILRNEPKDQQQRNDDRRIALARIGFGGSEGDYISQDAIRILLKRGDFANAADLLQYIDEPQLIEDMLVQKRYSALWPALETMAGPRLEKVRLTSVAVAERASQAEPANVEKLQVLINALRHAGRLDDAIALRSKLPANDVAMSSADEQMGWAINNLALALHEAGRADDADALFASLNDARMKDSNWRVSMIINRLELLVADGKFAKADELLSATETTTATDGSPYAKQLVRRLKYCTLSGLGRKEAAAKILPDLLEHAKDSYHATVDGLLCAGEADQAEKLVLTALSDDDFQQQFVRALQPVALTSDDPSVWDKRWKELRQRPAIAKEFERLGRDMPAHLVPPTNSKPS